MNDMKRKVLISARALRMEQERDKPKPKPEPKPQSEVYMEKATAFMEDVDSIDRAYEKKQETREQCKGNPRLLRKRKLRLDQWRDDMYGGPDG